MFKYLYTRNCLKYICSSYNHKTDFKHRNGGYNTQHDTLRLLSRHEQAMIFRLRTDHCRLRSHMRRSGIEKSAICTCGLEAQTIAHVLQP